MVWSFLCWVFLMLLTSKIPYSLNHHHFADMRNFLGVPNTLNVITNFPFLVVGVLSFVLCVQGGFFNISLRGEVWGWALFYAGIAGLAYLGSAYYHLKPDDSRVAWDTLPMMIVLSSLFSSFMVERVEDRIKLLTQDIGYGQQTAWHVDSSRLYENARDRYDTLSEV